MSNYRWYKLDNAATIVPATARGSDTRVFRVTCELKDGYLTVSAQKNLEEGEKNEEGKYIRRERYTGSQSRSFYIGEGIHEDDIHASFQDGILKLDIPKQEAQQIEDKRHFVQISD